MCFLENNSSLLSKLLPSLLNIHFHIVASNYLKFQLIGIVHIVFRFILNRHFSLYWKYALKSRRLSNFIVSIVDTYLRVAYWTAIAILLLTEVYLLLMISIVIWLLVKLLVIVNDLSVDILSIYWKLLATLRFPEILAHPLSVLPFLLIMVKSTYFRFVTATSITVNTFVLIGMIQSFNCCMTLLAG